jgi:hypothetical protein
MWYGGGISGIKILVSQSYLTGNEGPCFVENLFANEATMHVY